MKRPAYTLLSLLLTLLLAAFCFSCAPAKKDPVSSASAPSAASSVAPQEVSSEKYVLSLSGSDGNYGLPTDGLPQLTKPMVTGDFIQYWYCKNWTKAQWMTHLNQLKEAGITSLIIQTTFNVENGEINELCFKNDLDNKVLSVTCKKNTSFLGNLLDCIEAAGMKLWIGLGMNDAWWADDITRKEWCIQEAEINNKVIDQIEKYYAARYEKSIAGIYWPYEMYVQDAGLEENWSAMLNVNLDHLTKVHQSWPMMVCPYISEYYVNANGITPAEDAKVWETLIQKTRFRDGDIFCPQDGLASTGLKPETVTAFLMGMKSAVDKSSAKLKFWIDMENYASASVKVFTQQLDICSRIASGFVCFSYSHYYAPTADKGTANHDAYLAYLKTLR